MRKVILELNPNEMVRKLQGSFMDGIEEIEMVDLLRLDLQHGEKLGVVRIRFLPGGSVRSNGSLGVMEVVNVIEETENEAVVLVKAKAPPEFELMAKRFDLDLVWTTPMKVSREMIVYSFIGDDESIRKMVALLREFGETVRVSIQEATFQGPEMLSSLTARQKELLLEAKRLGYYNYPRSISAGDLAKAVGLSRSTVVEHLRKAENRLLDQVLEGH
ncbi:MAG TPA: helix-turn-helix domain-containing protein [Methanomassiliicoccales archaeon]